MSTMVLGLKTTDIMSLEYARDVLLPSVIQQLTSEKPDWTVTGHISYYQEIGQDEDNMFRVTLSVKDNAAVH